MRFVDLIRPYEAYKESIDRNIQDVIQKGNFILGQQVNDLEAVLSSYVETSHGIGVSSGTDALLIALMALGVGKDDEVITSPFTFIATVEVILALGAKPVFIDVNPETYLMNLGLLEAAISEKTKAVIPVSLYGMMCDFTKLYQILGKFNIPIIEDGAQSFGASAPEGLSCGVSTIGCTSFFPAKTFGCFGDGGMCFTNREDLAKSMREIRVHGQESRYHHVRLGINGRLDTLQAAILLAKWPFFQGEVEKRIAAGNYYLDALSDLDNILLPVQKDGYAHVYGQFTIGVPNREHITNVLQEKQIPFAIHYPTPLHLQPLLQSYGFKKGDFPEAEKASESVLSLPMHAFITQDEQDQVVSALKEALSG